MKNASTADFATLKGACRERAPQTVIVLGSGLGSLTEALADPLSVPFSAIPGLPASSVLGHRGCLTLGDWSGQPVLVFEGRLHFYEGHSPEVVARPLLIARELGARRILLTNAAGGIRDDLDPGRLMLIRDHLNGLRPWWWRQPGPGGCGGERPSPYDPALNECLLAAGRKAGVSLTMGVYAAWTGPSYETPAEIRALRRWGADAVGMSTALEVEAAAGKGMRCAAISCISNRAAGLTAQKLNHQEVLAVMASLGEQVGTLLGEVIRELGAGS
jgi:purine-nucleoside phosphorylase